MGHRPFTGRARSLSPKKRYKYLILAGPHTVTALQRLVYYPGTRGAISKSSAGNVIPADDRRPHGHDPYGFDMA
jgi:hypothetical protein